MATTTYEPLPELSAPTSKPWYSTLSRTAKGLILLTVAGIGGGVAGGILIFGDPGAPATSPPPLLPIVACTWWPAAAYSGFLNASAGASALDSVIATGIYAESHQLDGTVGWGGSPDESGATSLDALVMDGNTKDVGAVSGLTAVRDAIVSARRVMQFTGHTLLVGAGADNFSVAMGAVRWPTLQSPTSVAAYEAWVQNNCQPNYRMNVFNSSSCGPYSPLPTASPSPLAAPPPTRNLVGSKSSFSNHDTLGACAIDKSGSLAGGGTSNGASHKIPGRASDVAVVGAGVYADSAAGCAAATGDGDLTQRFLPAFLAVEFMRQGASPTAACEGAVRRIMATLGSDFHIGLLCMDTQGNVGGAAQGWTFTYGVASAGAPNGTAVQVTPLPPLTSAQAAAIASPRRVASSVFW